jgi:hypothetical protein
LARGVPAAPAEPLAALGVLDGPELELAARAEVPGALGAPVVAERERRPGALPGELAAPDAWEQAVSVVDGPAEPDEPERERRAAVLPGEPAALGAREQAVSVVDGPAEPDGPGRERQLRA